MGTLRIRKELDEKGEQMALLEFVKARLFPNLIKIHLRDVTLPAGGLAGLGELCEKELLYKVILENVKPEREDWRGFQKEVLILVKSSRHAHGELTIVNCPGFRPPLEFLSSLLSEQKEKMWSFRSDYEPPMKKCFLKFLNSWLLNAIENCGGGTPMRVLRLGTEATEHPSRYPYNMLQTMGAYCHYIAPDDRCSTGAWFALECCVQMKTLKRDSLNNFVFNKFLPRIREAFERETGAKRADDWVDWIEKDEDIAELLIRFCLHPWERGY